MATRGYSPRGTGAALLLLCCCPAFCSAMVVMQTGNFSLEFPSLPADFGPPIPPEGISGLLLEAQPPDACTELKPPPIKAGTPWVALIARSQQKDGCTFDIKVAHAAAAGAIAAIVHDDVFEPLILMAKDPRHPDPFIPSAFVTQKSGILMGRLMVQGETVVTITPLSEALWLSMVMSAAAGFLAVNVVLGALWIVRRQHAAATGGGTGSRPQQRQGMTASEIRALPIIVYEEPTPAASTAGGTAGSAASSAGGGNAGWEDEEEPETEGLQHPAGGSDSGSDSGCRGGGTRRVCAICLESYTTGDKLRVLPCQHRYHSGCIDQWLSSRRPVCPVCKADAHAVNGGLLGADESEEAAGPSVAAENVDLEAGRLPRRSRRRRRRSLFLLGRLGDSWAALRRQLLGVPAASGGSVGEGGGMAASTGSNSEVAEQRQQLLGGARGSRASSPLPTGAGLGMQRQRQQHVDPESAATLANFPAFFPPRPTATAASTTRSFGPPPPEIVPADAAEAGEPAGSGVVVAAAFAAAAGPSPQRSLVQQASQALGHEPQTTHQQQQEQQQEQHRAGWTAGRGGGGTFAFDSAASTPRAGPHSHLVQRDSTEGSETESEAE